VVAPMLLDSRGHEQQQIPPPFIDGRYARETFVKPGRRAPWWVIASDVVLIGFSMVIAYWIRHELRWFREISYDHPLSAYLPFGLVFTLLMLLAFQTDRVYLSWRAQQWLDQVYRIVNAMAKSVVVILAITFVLQPLQYSRLLLIEAGVISAILLALARVVQGWIASRWVGWTMSQR
jgi:FlaA1/EpsC-like NDP-sugar epimerase